MGVSGEQTCVCLSRFLAFFPLKQNGLKTGFRYRRMRTVCFYSLLKTSEPTVSHSYLTIGLDVREKERVDLSEKRQEQARIHINEILERINIRAVHKVLSIL